MLVWDTLFFFFCYFQPLSLVEAVISCCLSVECQVTKNCVCVCCSDITNTLVGISGETVPEGRNLHIYWPLSNHAIWWVVVFTAGVSHHTPPPPGTGNRCIISQYHYFAGNYLAFLPPWGDHVTPQGFPLWKMAANARYITPEEIDLLGFLHQNIMQKLEEEAARQGLTRTHPWVIQAVVRHFNLGPSPHQVFDRLVWRIAHSHQVSFVVLVQVTPHVCGELFVPDHCKKNWRFAPVFAEKTKSYSEVRPWCGQNGSNVFCFVLCE